MVKKKNNMKLIIVVVVIALAALVTYQAIQASVEDPVKSALAQCLTANEVAMYGVDSCPACIQQKTLFGSSFKHIDYAECDKTNRCSEKGVTSTPTWINADDERLVGVRQLGELAEFGNCTEALETVE